MGYQDDVKQTNGCALIAAVLISVFISAMALVATDANAATFKTGKVQNVYFDGFVGRKVGTCGDFVSDVAGFSPWRNKSVRTMTDLHRITVDAKVGKKEPVKAGDVILYDYGNVMHVDIIAEIQEVQMGTDTMVIAHVYGSNTGNDRTGYERWIFPEHYATIVGYSHTPLTVK
jgi:hypothetical protein